MNTRSPRNDYWRSLEELADTPEYRAFVEKEFPGLAEELTALDPSRPVVVFPHPEGPMIACIVLPFIEQSSPLRAMTSDLPVL